LDGRPLRFVVEPGDEGAADQVVDRPHLPRRSLAPEDAHLHEAERDDRYRQPRITRPDDLLLADPQPPARLLLDELPGAGGVEQAGEPDLFDHWPILETEQRDLAEVRLDLVSSGVECEVRTFSHSSGCVTPMNANSSVVSSAKSAEKSSSRSAALPTLTAL